MILDNSFSCYLKSLMTCNLFVFKKRSVNFEICHFFILFLSTSGAALVKTGKYQFRRSKTLLLEPFFYSIYVYLVLILRVFKTFFLFSFFSIIAFFMSPFRFLLD